MLEHIARNKGYTPLPSTQGGQSNTGNSLDLEGLPMGGAVARAGAGRLRDAIVFGYMMQRHRARGKVHMLGPCALVNMIATVIPFNAHATLLWPPIPVAPAL